MELHEIIKKIFSDYEISIFGQGRTNMRRSEAWKKEKLPKKIIKFLIKKMYSFDNKHLHFLRQVEHLRAYQLLARIQSSCEEGTDVYKIDKETDFFNPLIALFVISKENVFGKYSEE